MNARKDRGVRSGRWVSWVVGCALLGVPLTMGAADAAPGDIAVLKNMSKAFSSVAKKAMPAVVFIKVQKGAQSQAGYGGGPSQGSQTWDEEDWLDFFFRGQGGSGGGRRPNAPPMIGQGSGFIITKDGYILTNNHVVGDADTITVKLHDGRELPAERVGSDPRTEVAVIKIKADNLPVLELGDSTDLEIGEWVIAIGNPFGLSETLTVGVVSAKGRSRVGITDYEDFIQTDAAINPGNSGGPLLNIEGKAIGINTAILSQSGGSLGIGFAIPIRMAIAIKDQLVKTGKVTRGFLGLTIQDVTPELSESFGVPQSKGVLVSEVTRGSTAEKAGVKAGDVITALDGKTLEDTGSFRNQIAMMAPGTDIVLAVIRNGKTQSIKAVVGSLSEGGAGKAIGSSTSGEKLGLLVEPLSEQTQRQFGYEPGAGVLITQVRPGSPAHQAGIQAGQLVVSVNQQPVQTLDEFNNALAKDDKAVLLLVRDTRYARFVTLRLK